MWRIPKQKSRKNSNNHDTISNHQDTNGDISGDWLPSTDVAITHCGDGQTEDEDKECCTCQGGDYDDYDNDNVDDDDFGNLLVVDEYDGDVGEEDDGDMTMTKNKNKNKKYMMMTTREEDEYVDDDGD